MYIHDYLTEEEVAEMRHEHQLMLEEEHEMMVLEECGDSIEKHHEGVSHVVKNIKQDDDLPF